MKTYCLDTSVFIDNPKVLDLLGDAQIIVPFCVLGELDRNRKREGTVGRNAREAVRNIDKVRHERPKRIRFISSDFDVPTNDLKIIACAEWIQTQEGVDVTLLSNDLGLRIQAEAKKIKTAQFKRNKDNLIYSGSGSICLDEDLIGELHEKGQVKIHVDDLVSNEYDCDHTTHPDAFYPNQMLIVNGVISNSSTLAKIEIINKTTFLLHKVRKYKPWGAEAACVEQAFAIELLNDPRIELVSLVGKAGCGKTFLATACGLQQVIEEGMYDRIIILRPIVTVGKDIGYLPGTMEEKLEPWIQPIKDNLITLFGGDRHAVDFHFQNGNIVVEAMSYIRGRSIPNSFIIVDECQNLTSEELKTVLTRAAQGSKIVLTGDIEQIDNTSVDSQSNGLSKVVEVFKNEDISGHITLTKGQRSELATIAAEIL